MEVQTILDAKEKFQRKFGRPARCSDRQLQLYALLTAVAVNLLFWGVLFKSRAPDAASKDSGSSVWLLDLDPNQGFGSLARWIEYHDPAKIGDSGHKSGFSAQLSGCELNFEPPAGRPMPEVTPTIPEVRGFERVALKEKPRVFGMPLPPAPAPSAGNAPLKSPVATDDRGRNVRIAVGAAALPGGRAKGETILSVTFSGGNPNFMLRQSCGDPRLDGRAAGLVSSGVCELAPPPELVIIRWPLAEPGKEAAK